MFLPFCAILRYIQHLIKPLFFNTRGRFISHVTVFALALDLSYFFRNYWSNRFTETHLAHIVLCQCFYETC